MNENEIGVPVELSTSCTQLCPCHVHASRFVPERNFPKKITVTRSLVRMNLESTVFTGF